MQTNEARKKKNPVTDTLKFVGIAVIAAALIFSFIISSMLGGGNAGGSVGKVFGQSIVMTRDSRLATNYAAAEERVIKQNIPITPEFRKYILQDAFRATAAQMILLRRANDFGVSASPNAIDRQVQYEFMTNVNGQTMLNQQEYERYKRDTPRSVKLQAEKSIHDNLVVQYLYSELFQMTRPTAGQLEEIFAIESATRKARMVYFGAPNGVYTADYGDDVLRPYFEKNTASFIEFTFSVIACSDESRAQRQYENLAGDPSLFSERRSEITELTDEEYASAFGAPIGERVYYADLPKEFQEKLSKAKNAPSVLKPFYYYSPELNQGFYYLILLEQAAVPSYEMADKNTVREYYINAHYDALANETLDRIEDRFLTLSASGASFEQIARETGASIYVTDSFPFEFDKVISLEGRRGTLPVSDETFLRTAFSQAVGETSSVIRFSEGVGIITTIAAQTPETAPQWQSDQVYAAYNRVMMDQVSSLEGRFFEIEFKKANVSYTGDNLFR